MTISQPIDAAFSVESRLFEKLDENISGKPVAPLQCKLWYVLSPKVQSLMVRLNVLIYNYVIFYYSCDNNKSSIIKVTVKKCEYWSIMAINIKVKISITNVIKHTIVDTYTEANWATTP